MWAIVWSVAMYVAWALMLAATGAYVWFRLEAVLAEGAGTWDPKQPFTVPEAKTWARRAQLFRIAAVVLAVTALVLSALRLTRGGTALP